MSIEQELAEWAQLLRELDTDSTEIQGDLFGEENVKSEIIRTDSKTGKDESS